MVNLKNSGSKFFTSCVRYTDDGVEKVEYTDSPSMYEIMVKEYSDRLKNLSISNVEPTEEQKARLEEFNKVTEGLIIEGFVEAANLFVVHGFIDAETCPQFLNNIANKYKDTTKTYILDKYKRLLSAYKTEKEVSGCIFMDHTIKTDAESQSKITGTLIMMQTGAIPTIDFKTATGWLTLNAEQFTQLAFTVATHVQVCFKTESELMTTLSKKGNADLIKLDPETNSNVSNKNQESKQTIYDLYEAMYTNYIKQLLSSSSSSKGSK